MMGCLYSFLIYLGGIIVIAPILFLISGSGSSAGSTIAGIISLPLVALSLWAGFTISKNRDKAKANEAELEKSQKEKSDQLQRETEEQKFYLTHLNIDCRNAITGYESLPDLLYSANKCLDQAEKHFQGNAPIPFWRSIEQASINLAKFTQTIHQIESASTDYASMVSKYNDIPPVFPLAKRAVQKLGTGKLVSDRMDNLVSTAHQNHDNFSTIYLTMQTNKILVAGFTNLGQALEEMKEQLTSSIDRLTHSVEASGSDIRNAVDRVNSQVEQMNSTNRERYAEQRDEAVAAAERERTTIERLDDLRRGFKPALGSF